MHDYLKPEYKMRDLYRSMHLLWIGIGRYMARRKQA